MRSRVRPGESLYSCLLSAKKMGQPRNDARRAELVARTGLVRPRMTAEARRSHLRTHRARRLNIEFLGTRTLLSGGHRLFHGVLRAHAPRVAEVRQIGINGTIQGTAQGPQGLVPADSGVKLDLSGSGRLWRLGRTTLSGSLHGPGYIDQGHAEGTLTLTTPRGTETLALRGPNEPGNSPLPSVFSYTIAHATGSLRNQAGSGTVELLFAPGTPAPTAPGTGGPPVSGPLYFALVFHPGTTGA